MYDRIANKELALKVSDASTAASIIQDGMTVAFGGYTSCGYPKAVARELVHRSETGEKIKLNVITGSMISEIDELLGKSGMIERRVPMHESRALSKLINNGELHYVEQQMNKMPWLIQYSLLGEIDVAVIEALRITEEGFIVPTNSVGLVPHIVNHAKSIIIEVNSAQPEEIEGFHDIYLPGFPPNREPIPLLDLNQRIGSPVICIDPLKVKYVVETNIPDAVGKPPVSTDLTRKVSENLMNFLEIETKNHFCGSLPPLQTGFGNLANDIVHALAHSSFDNIKFLCGVFQEANMELIASGKVAAATTGSIQMTEKVIDLLKNKRDEFRNCLVIRNIDITNNAEITGRFGLISLTSAIEVDIYGNVNSSHIAGTQVVNGIGGGANFAENAGISILLLPSEGKNGEVSTIVPMVPHQDICEHDIDVIITENGVADLRGKDDVERARAIIAECASPGYSDLLSDYLDRAIATTGGHHPHILSEAFRLHTSLKEKGSMRA